MREPLAEEFVEGESGGDGDIEGVGLAGHGEADAIQVLNVTDRARL